MDVPALRRKLITLHVRQFKEQYANQVSRLAVSTARHNAVLIVVVIWLMILTLYVVKQ